MRLAFFTSIVSDGNPMTGFEIANDAILAGLRELGHSVTVFGFKLPRQADIDDADCVVLGTRELENASVGVGQKMQWLVQAVRSGLPFAAAKLADYSIGELDQLIELHGPFDAHILNSYQMAAAFPHLRGKPHVYVAHNVEHRSAAQNAEATRSALQRFLYRRDARLLRRLETQLCAGANFVWTFSADDLDDHKLDKGAGSRLPLYLPGASQTEPTTTKKYDVGLIGTWSWQPNFVGLKWFVEQVVPKLPDTVSVAIAGNVPDQSFAGDGAGNERVTFLGRVDSADGFLNSVRVVPLISRGGTGVQLKTIEVFQAGRACVATSSSLRGIDVLPANCAQADTEEAFSQALIAMIEKEKLENMPTVDGGLFKLKQKQNLALALQQGIAALA
ncbi:MAG: glycosyltransferase family 4 protein [Rhizobiaceae bacterium]